MSDPRGYRIEEFVEDLGDGRWTRREVLRRLAAIAGGTALGSTLRAACTPAAQPAAAPKPAAAAAAPAPPAATKGEAPPAAAGVTVRPDDPAIEAGRVEFAGQGATVFGYLSRPKGAGPFPAVLVCHENRGLTEHINDVTRRLAKEGYVALAVDLLSREGGFDKIADPAQIPGLLSNVPPERFVQDFLSGLAYLQSQPWVQRDRVGMIGFCFGGGVTWRVATKSPELRVVIPFYGPPPPMEDVPNIRAAVFAVYGERDQRINQSIPTVEAAMKQHNKTFDKIIYPNAEHAFFNDTSERYNREAALDVWPKMLTWLEKYLRS